MAGLSSGNGLAANAGLSPSEGIDFAQGFNSPTYVANFLTSTAMPAWITFSRAGNAMQFDATGKLTYAPNNQVLYSNDVTHWTLLGATTPTSTKILASSGTNIHGAYNTITAMVSGTNYMVSAEFFYTNWRYVSLRGDYPATAYVDVDVSTSISYGSSGASNIAISTTTDGWVRVVFTYTATGSGAGNVFVALEPNATPGQAASWTAAGTENVLVRNVQVQAITYQTAYQGFNPTTTSAYYGPRFDYDPVTLAPRGLLIEESRTNSLKGSQDAANATYWAQLALTSAATNVTGPDGLTSLTTLTENTAAGQHGIYGAGVQNQITVTSGQTVTLSGVFKAGTRRYVAFGINSGTNDFAVVIDTQNWTLTTFTRGVSGVYSGSSITQVGNGIYRVSVAGSITGQTVYTPVVTFSDVANPASLAYSYTGTSTTVICGMFQFEAGAAFPTSYIPTTTAAVTRAADVAQITGGALSVLQGAAVSTVVETFALASPANTFPRLFADNNNRGLNIDTSSKLSLYNGTLSVLTPNTATWTATNRSGFGISSLGRSACLNGQSATDGNTQTAATAWYLLSGGPNGSYSNGYVRSLALYSKRLPDTVLQAKSTVGAPY